MNNIDIFFDNNSTTPEKEYIEKFGYLYEKHELLSEKLKNYNIITAENHLREKLQPYHYFLAKVRISFSNSISVYKINNDVLDKIKNTTIEKVPEEIPRLYSRPFIIEPHDLNKSLFGDIDSIIGFYNNFEGIKEKENPIKRFSILFHTKPNNDSIWYDTIFEISKFNIEERKNIRFMYLANNLFHLLPFDNRGHWDFSRIDYERNILIKNDYCDTCIYKKDCTIALRRDYHSKYILCLDGLYDNIISFITIFNYMIEAENSPLETKKTIEHTNYFINKRGKTIDKKEDWIIKYIYLDKTKIKYENNIDPSALNKDGLISKDIKVRGHLRHQAHGTGLKERKWIYIESYISKKWVKNGDTKIIVNLQKE